MAGMAAENAAKSKTTATKSTISANGLDRILRAGGRVDARIRQDGRDKTLIQTEETNQEPRHESGSNQRGCRATQGPKACQQDAHPESEGLRRE